MVSKKVNGHRSVKETSEISTKYGKLKLCSIGIIFVKIHEVETKNYNTIYFNLFQ